MKRVIYFAITAFLAIMLIACVSVTVDYLRDSDFSHAVIGLIFSILEFKGMRKMYRKTIAKETPAQVPMQPMPMQPMMPMQQGMPTSPNPEMDHVDDMSVQYNPYFADVYEEQLAAKRKEAATMQRQLAENQMLEQQMMQMQQQMTQQQMAQQQMAQQQMGQQMMPPYGPGGMPEPGSPRMPLP